MARGADARTLTQALFAGLAIGILISQLVIGPFVPAASAPGTQATWGDPESKGGAVRVIDGHLDEGVHDVTPVDDRPAWRQGPGADTRPNILLIVTDDQGVGMMDAMPLTQAWIPDEGVTFSQGYVTTPVCCPSRASILTGMYASHHEVRLLKDPLELPTMVDRLHEAGYRTGLVGKYLNSWDGTNRPEFDHWLSFSGGWAHFDDPRLYMDDEEIRYEGYITHALEDSALSFLKDATADQRPFFLMFTPNAPHAPAVPAPEDKGRFSDVILPPSPAINELDVSDKPAWLQERSRLPAHELADQEAFLRRQLASLASVDRAIDEMMQLLEARQTLQDTVVIFTSDNGILHGQHRLTNKEWVYEPSIKVPFFVRGPGIDGPRTVDGVVANIDIAPTIYDLAGLEIPPEVDGWSLVPLLSTTAANPDTWRQGLLVEAWPRWSPAWKAVHDGRYVYVETQGDTSELYDLVTDPHQLDNRIDDPGLSDVQARLETRLDQLRPGW